MFPANTNFENKYFFTNLQIYNENDKREMHWVKFIYGRGFRLLHYILFKGLPKVKVWFWGLKCRVMFCTESIG